MHDNEEETEDLMNDIERIANGEFVFDPTDVAHDDGNHG